LAITWKNVLLNRSIDPYYAYICLTYNAKNISVLRVIVSDIFDFDSVLQLFTLFVSITFILQVEYFYDLSIVCVGVRQEKCLNVILRTYRTALVNV
jgi:hypothetical protein